MTPRVCSQHMACMETHKRNDIYKTIFVIIFGTTSSLIFALWFYSHIFSMLFFSQKRMEEMVVQKIVTKIVILISFHNTQTQHNIFTTLIF